MSRKRYVRPYIIRAILYVYTRACVGHTTPSLPPRFNRSIKSAEGGGGAGGGGETSRFAKSTSPPFISFHVGEKVGRKYLIDGSSRFSKRARETDKFLSSISSRQGYRYRFGSNFSIFRIIFAEQISPSPGGIDLSSGT